MATLKRRCLEYLGIGVVRANWTTSFSYVLQATVQHRDTNIRQQHRKRLRFTPPTEGCADAQQRYRHRILPTRSKGRPIYIGTQAKDLAPGVIFCNAQARARSQKGRDISRSEESKMKDATMTHCLVWSWLTDSALWWASMFNTPRCWTSTPLGSPPLVAKGSCAPC